MSAAREWAVARTRRPNGGTLTPAACQPRHECMAVSSSERSRNAKMQCSASVWQRCAMEGVEEIGTALSPAPMDTAAAANCAAGTAGRDEAEPFELDAAAQPCTVTVGIGSLCDVPAV